MKIVFYVESANRAKAEDIINKDPVGRQSIYIRDASALGMERKGTFIFINGSDEACTIAKEWLTDLAEEIEGEEREEIIRKIEDEENSAIEGFGSIVG